MNNPPKIDRPVEGGCDDKYTFEHRTGANAEVWANGWASIPFWDYAKVKVHLKDSTVTSIHSRVDCPDNQ